MQTAGLKETLVCDPQPLTLQISYLGLRAIIGHELVFKMINSVLLDISKFAETIRLIMIQHVSLQ